MRCSGEKSSKTFAFVSIGRIEPCPGRMAPGSPSPYPIPTFAYFHLLLPGSTPTAHLLFTDTAPTLAPDSFDLTRVRAWAKAPADPALSVSIHKSKQRGAASRAAAGPNPARRVD